MMNGPIEITHHRARRPSQNGPPGSPLTHETPPAYDEQAMSIFNGRVRVVLVVPSRESDQLRWLRIQRQMYDLFIEYYAPVNPFEMIRDNRTIGATHGGLQGRQG
jgi:hypothetical protein